MRKRRHGKRRTNGGNKFSKVLVTLLLVAVLGLGFYYFAFDKKTVNELKNKVVNKVTKEEKYSLSLTMVGDYLIHSSVYNDANSLAGYNGYDFKPMITYVKDIVSNYDLAYYNQETILGGSELGLSDYPCFNSPYEAGDAMIDAGFNLVSLATNHTMDSRARAVENSCNYWSGKDVIAAGSYCSEESRNTPVVKEKNGIKYAMLNYTYGTNGMPVGEDYYVNVWPTDETYATYTYPDSDEAKNHVANDSKYQSYKEQVKKDVDAAKNDADIIIVAMHWGVEYVDQPTAYQIDEAEYLSSLGVKIIIGTHPHIIQPVAWVGDTIVFYSLGNFISAQYQNGRNNGVGYCWDYSCTTELMGSLKINKVVKGKESTITVEDVSTQLLYNYYSGWRNFKVVPFSNSDIANYLPGYADTYNKYKAVVQSIDSNIPVKELGA